MFGSRETYGIKATLLDPYKPELEGGFAAIKIVHGAAGAAAIKGSIGVDVLKDDIGFGSASDYVLVPAGDALIRLSRSADSKIVANQVVTVQEGKTYSFVVGGDIEYLVTADFLEN